MRLERQQSDVCAAANVERKVNSILGRRQEHQGPAPASQPQTRPCCGHRSTRFSLAVAGSHRVVSSAREHGSPRYQYYFGLARVRPPECRRHKSERSRRRERCWRSVAFFSFETSVNGNENANGDFDYCQYVACCCLHKPDGDCRRAQSPEGDPRSSSGCSTASRRHGSAAGGARNVRTDSCRQQIM